MPIHRGLGFLPWRKEAKMVRSTGNIGPLPLSMSLVALLLGARDDGFAVAKFGEGQP
jgi:hypothetical protein